MSGLVVAEFSPRILGEPEAVVEAADKHPEYRVIVVGAPDSERFPVSGLNSRLRNYANMVKNNNQHATDVIPGKVLGLFDSLYAGLLNQEDRDALRVAGIKEFRPTPTRNESYYATLGNRLNGKYLARAIGRNCLASATYLEPAILFGLEDELNGLHTRKGINAQIRTNPGQLVIPASYGTDVLNRTHLLSADERERTSTIYQESLYWDRVVVE
jgi:hypothetical protein